ncbi:MAG: hypothetical protein QOK47_1670 [Actinomycetota bacterium]|jgi:uncharacterized cupredoxin-like copper-binding protein|nr:hypothetical protein [Actinomycetota bacterium]
MNLRVLVAAMVIAMSGVGCGLTEKATPFAMTINHSSFGLSEMKFEAGDVIRFTVTNSDPIDHELIIGDRRVQDIHEKGTEAQHGAVPGEISIPAGETRTTVYKFDEPGTLFFACHLPGHFTYGMHGDIIVNGIA